ncbi:MAG: methyltransferase domain-containing protein [Acidobacteriota bacterium]
MHRTLAARETLGVDTSEAMLAKAAAFVDAGLSFRRGDLAAFRDAAPFDLVFSNAALQWVDDHAAVLARLAAVIASSGQLAIQMPANHDAPSHVVAARVASEEPFRTALSGHVRTSPLLLPERYAELLHDLGFAEQEVVLRVYGHVLARRDDVIEWVKGTLLTDYQKRLSPELYGAFLARYREALLRAFRRIALLLPVQAPVPLGQALIVDGQNRYTAGPRCSTSSFRRRPRGR